MSSQAIISQLAELSPKELKELAARANFLLGTDDSPEDEDLVHRQIVQVLRDYGVLSTPPLKKLPHYSQFKKGVVDLLEYVEAYFAPKKKIDKIKVVMILVKMLARQIKREEIPVSHRTISQALNRVGSIVELQFPGYRESGLLPMLIAKHQAV